MKYLKNMNLQLKNVTLVFDYKPTAITKKEFGKEFTKACKELKTHTDVNEDELCILRCKVWDKDENKPELFIKIPVITNSLHKKKEGNTVLFKWDGKEYLLRLKQLGTNNGYAPFEQAMASFSDKLARKKKDEELANLLGKMKRKSKRKKEI